MNFDGTVKRTDLNLRSKYPEINTLIYKINEAEYIIQCEDLEENFTEFEKEFYNSIKPLGIPLKVSLHKPEIYDRIIPKISDDEIGKNFEGILFSTNEILNLLIGKFPKVHFQKINRNQNVLEIYVAKFKVKIPNETHFKFLSLPDEQKIKTFLKGLNLPTEFRIISIEVDRPKEVGSFLRKNPVQYIYAANISKKSAQKFCLRDEAIWFDNIDGIFKGEFKKNDLFFFDSDDYSCYVDYSSFDNIDLRNHLLLFRTVYLTLPFDTSLSGWLNTKKIKKFEFLELVQKGRIKIILTQPEFRYDLKFIQEVYEVNPNAIITRRAIAALQQIDIVQISDDYIFRSEHLKELKVFSNVIAEHINSDPKHIFDFFAWPIMARRKSFENLHFAGNFSSSNFGVNNVIEKKVSDELKKDLSFDFIVNSSPIHLANSLNATYFPFKAKDGYSDVFYANVMGEMLNFYRNAKPETIYSFIENRKEIKSGVIPINPIDIIEVNDYISLSDFDKILSQENIYPKGYQLLQSLSDLSTEERTRKISNYNFQVENKINSQDKSRNIIDLGTNVFLDTVGGITGLSIIGSLFSILKISSSTLQKSFPEIKNITSVLEKTVDSDKKNIHYLTKINRVARVKKF